MPNSSASVSKSVASLSELRPRERAVRRLRQLIEDGSLPHGEVLPPEIALAERLGVKRGTLRHALTQLEQDGWLRFDGGHRKIVVSPADAARDSGWQLRQTLVSLTPNPAGHFPGHQATGWGDRIDQGVMEAVHESGLHFLAFHPARLEADEWKRLVAARPKAVVVTALNSEGNDVLALVQQLKNAEVPFAIYGDDPTVAAFDRVTPDMETGAYELTRWLIEQGRKRVLQMGPEQERQAWWFAGRRAGYEKAMREAGLESLPVLRLPAYQEISADEAAKFESRARYYTAYLAEHLTGAEPVDAILALSDSEFFPIARACRFLGKVPNEDVALVGFDNYWADVPMRKIEKIQPLATVDKNNRGTGVELVELALRRAAGELPEEAQRVFVTPQLIIVGDVNHTEAR